MYFQTQRTKHCVGFLLPYDYTKNALWFTNNLVNLNAYTLLLGNEYSYTIPQVLKLIHQEY